MELAHGRGDRHISLRQSKIRRLSISQQTKGHRTNQAWSRTYEKPAKRHGTKSHSKKKTTNFCNSSLTLTT